MTLILLATLSSIYTGIFTYVKSKFPFVIEVAMVTLCFGSIVGRFCILA